MAGTCHKRKFPVSWPLNADVAVISNTAGFHALYWLIGYCVKHFTDR